MSNERYFYVTARMDGETSYGIGFAFIKTNGNYPYFMEIKRRFSNVYSMTTDDIVILSVIEFNSYQDFLDARDGVN